MKQILFETDWLASMPVFYNEQTGQASRNINDVIDYANLELDPEGLHNYMDFGYSVLGLTPIKHVKSLRHSARLMVDERGKLSIEYWDDPVDAWLGRRISEADTIELLRARVRAWEHSVNGEIVIPTSGGYDSRLLNWMIEDKSRIRSFSYGISDSQSASYEVVYARQLAKILGTRWEQIPLGDFHQYFEDWDKLFGASTHAHGMYHIEFYKKILSRVSGGNPFLTGIIGDAWAGSVVIPNLDTAQDVKLLGYTHGIIADSAMSQLPSKRLELENYYEHYKERLQDPRIRVIEAMRFKIILLSYLMIVPHSLGFEPWSPFLDIEVAMAMVNLPPERRRGRSWQRDLFRRQGLDIENMGLKALWKNTLDLQALHRQPVQPLEVDLLREVVQPRYVEWVNKNVLDTSPRLVLRELLNIRKVGGALRRLGAKDKTLEAYYAYLVLRPIQSLIERRNRNVKSVQ